MSSTAGLLQQTVIYSIVVVHMHSPKSKSGLYETGMCPKVFGRKLGQEIQTCCSRSLATVQLSFLSLSIFPSFIFSLNFLFLGSCMKKERVLGDKCFTGTEEGAEEHHW